jgi:dephospho-CoA kinase
MRPLEAGDTIRVALVGKSGAGKSEVAKILQESFDCQIVKTGAICRSISKILFGNDDKTSTQILDDVLTSIDSSIFLKAALREVQVTTPAVIDALRFSSDYELAKDANYITLRVIAEDDQRVSRLAQRGQQFDLQENGKHRSEVELENHDCDLNIVNDCTLDTLRERVVGGIERLRN